MALAEGAADDRREHGAALVTGRPLVAAAVPRRRHDEVTAELVDLGEPLPATDGAAVRSSRPPNAPPA